MFLYLFIIFLLNQTKSNHIASLNHIAMTVIIVHLDTSYRVDTVANSDQGHGHSCSWRKCEPKKKVCETISTSYKIQSKIMTKSISTNRINTKYVQTRVIFHLNMNICNPWICDWNLLWIECSLFCFQARAYFHAAAKLFKGKGRKNGDAAWKQCAV